MSPLARRIITALAVAGALVLPFAPRVAEAHWRHHGGMSVAVDFFYDDLAPYGQWVDTSSWGMVWTPAGVGPEWRPYTTGHWIYADCGWTWVADEPWGWAPFHYGRWAYEPAYGWVWVPGQVWAPAWVAWRWGGGYVGWAPLAPIAGYGVDYWEGPATTVSFGWSFIGEREIFAPRVREVMVPQTRVTFIMGHTRDVTRFDRDGDRVVSRALDPGTMSRAIGRPIPVHRIADSAERGSARVHGDVVQVYRPVPGGAGSVVRPVRPAEPTRPAPSTTPARGEPQRPWGTPPGQVVRTTPERAPDAVRGHAPGEVLQHREPVAPPRPATQVVPRAVPQPQSAPPVYRRPQPAAASAPAYGRPAQPTYRPAPVARPAAPVRPAPKERTERAEHGREQR